MSRLFLFPPKATRWRYTTPHCKAWERAITKQQAEAISLTDSQMDAINAQAEVMQARANELMAQGRTQAGVTQTSPPVSEPAMADAISTLMNLPTNAQTQAKVEAARQAYFDYLTASPEGKVAAYDGAVKQLRESINAALEIKGLDAEARETLDELLGEMWN